MTSCVQITCQIYLIWWSSNSVKSLSKFYQLSLWKASYLNVWQLTHKNVKKKQKNKSFFLIIIFHLFDFFVCDFFHKNRMS